MTTKAEYEPIGDQAGEDKVLDNGVMLPCREEAGSDLKYSFNSIPCIFNQHLG
jgi:hypothetical protein